MRALGSLLARFAFRAGEQAWTFVGGVFVAHGVNSLDAHLATVPFRLAGATGPVGYLLLAGVLASVGAEVSRMRALIGEINAGKLSQTDTLLGSRALTIVSTRSARSMMVRFSLGAVAFGLILMPTIAQALPPYVFRSP